MRLGFSTAASAAIIGLGMASGASAATCNEVGAPLFDENLGRQIVVSNAAACEGFGAGTIPFAAELEEFQKTNSMIQLLAAVQRDGAGSMPLDAPSGATIVPPDISLPNGGIQIGFTVSDDGPTGDWWIETDPLVLLFDVFVGFRLATQDDQEFSDPTLGWGTFSLASGVSGGTWTVQQIMELPSMQSMSQEFSLLAAEPVVQPALQQMYVWGAATVIPLPPAMLLLGSALGGLVLMRRRKTAA